MESSSVLIIVLNYNGEGILEDCLGSIRENTVLDEERHQLLVVDNNSSDESLKTAREIADEVIENERNLGFDTGNNIGIYENPDYEYYMLINNDTEVEEGWLRNLVETAESNEKTGIVGPKITYLDGEIQSAGFNLEKEGIGLENLREGMNKEEYNEVEQVDRVHGAAFMISRDLVEEIGYLDEIYTLANFEEWDYCNRAKSAGFKVFVDGRSTIVHKEDKTKQKMENELVYLLNVKNALKGKAINRSKKEIAVEFKEFGKRLAASMIGYKYNPLSALQETLKEFIIDFPDIIHKRYNREEYIPSYYCEGIKDYSKRYN